MRALGFLVLVVAVLMGCSRPTAPAAELPIDAGASSLVVLTDATYVLTSSAPDYVLMATGGSDDARYPKTDWRHWRGTWNGTLYVGRCGSLDSGTCDVYVDAGDSPCIRGCRAMYSEPLRWAQEEQRWDHADAPDGSSEEWVAGVRGCMRACVKSHADRVRWSP